MYFFIYAVRNVCGLVGCEGRTTPEHAASAPPSSRSSCISSRRQIRRGERSGEEKREKGLKKPQTLVSTLVMLLFLSVFFGGHGGHSEVWRDGHF